jgi:hypothetical protein
LSFSNSLPAFHFASFASFASKALKKTGTIPVFPFTSKAKSSIWNWDEVTNNKNARKLQMLTGDFQMTLWWYNLEFYDSVNAMEADDTHISRYNSL